MMNVPAEKLKSRVYNVTAMSFTPAQLVEEMKQYYPHLTVEYKPDSRQQIGKSYFLEYSMTTNRHHYTVTMPLNEVVGK